MDTFLNSSQLLHVAQAAGGLFENLSPLEVVLFFLAGIIALIINLFKIILPFSGYILVIALIVLIAKKGTKLQRKSRNDIYRIVAIILGLIIVNTLFLWRFPHYLETDLRKRNERIIQENAEKRAAQKSSAMNDQYRQIARTFNFDLYDITPDASKYSKIFTSVTPLQNQTGESALLIYIVTNNSDELHVSQYKTGSSPATTATTRLSDDADCGNNNRLCEFIAYDANNNQILKVRNNTKYAANSRRTDTYFITKQGTNIAIRVRTNPGNSFDITSLVNTLRQVSADEIIFGNRF